MSICSCKLYCHKLSKRELVKPRYFSELLIDTEKHNAVLVIITCLLSIPQLNLCLEVKKVVSARQKRWKLILVTAKIIIINRHILYVESLVSTIPQMSSSCKSANCWVLSAKVYLHASPTVWFSDLFLSVKFQIASSQKQITHDYAMQYVTADLQCMFFVCHVMYS